MCCLPNRFDMFFLFITRVGEERRRTRAATFPGWSPATRAAGAFSRSSQRSFRKPSTLYGAQRSRRGMAPWPLVCKFVESLEGWYLWNRKMFEKAWGQNHVIVYWVFTSLKARAEWEALQHALDFAPDLQQDLFHGMLSGGGMSCQLARYLDMESLIYPPHLFHTKVSHILPVSKRTRHM